MHDWNDLQAFFFFKVCSIDVIHGCTVSTDGFCSLDVFLACPRGIKRDELVQNLPETSVFELQGILELLWMHSELQIWKSARLSLGMVM